MSRAYHNTPTGWGYDGKSNDEAWVKFELRHTKKARPCAVLVDSVFQPVLTLAGMRSLHSWLGTRIAEIEAAKQKRKARKKQA